MVDERDLLGVGVGGDGGEDGSGLEVRPIEEPDELNRGAFSGTLKGWSGALSDEKPSSISA